MTKLQKIFFPKAGHIVAINQTLEYMRKEQIYDFEGDLVSIERGKLLIHDKHTLNFWLANRIKYVEESKTTVGKKFRDVNPLPNWMDQILSLREHRKLKKVNAIITAPIISKDGQLIAKAGYHSKTGLYYDNSQYPNKTLKVNTRPNEQELADALSKLLVPFEKFPYASNLDRSVMLAAVLTAIMRPVFKECPGFGFDAPVAGTGKTLLAQSIGQLMVSPNQPILTYADDGSRNDDETRKRLFSALMAGEKCMLIDNVQKTFDSSSLSTYTTSSVYTDRKLGGNSNRSFPSKMLILLTGNNLSLSKDLERRFPLCRIDAQTENMQTRKFSIRPISYVKSHRIELVMAGLTLIKGWLCTQEYKTGKMMVHREIESFDEWDSLVGQTVAWIAAQKWSYKDGKKQFCDVAPAFTGINKANPEEEALASLFAELFKHFGNGSFTSSDVLNVSLKPEGKSLSDSILMLSSSDKLNTVSIGKLLTQRNGLILNGLALKPMPKLKRAAVWKIQKSPIQLNESATRNSA